MHGEYDQIAPFALAGKKSVELGDRRAAKVLSWLSAPYADVINADLLAFLKG